MGEPSVDVATNPPARWISGPFWRRAVFWTVMFAVIQPPVDLALSPLFGSTPFDFGYHLWRSVFMGAWMALLWFPMTRWTARYRAFRKRSAVDGPSSNP